MAKSAGKAKAPAKPRAPSRRQHQPTATEQPLDAALQQFSGLTLSEMAQKQRSE